MNILGLNAYHGDSAAALFKDGELIAAAEEERFRRVKHWAGLPTEAIKYCLKEAGIDFGQVDHLAINRKPGVNNLRRASFVLRHRPNWRLLMDRVRSIGKVATLETALGKEFGQVSAQIHNVEHHLAHLASSFLVSDFEEAVCVSVDGFGDFASAAWGMGRKSKGAGQMAEVGGQKSDVRGQGLKINSLASEGRRTLDFGRQSEICIDGRVYFPHSLGIFYSALTQFLGFPQYGDEYKVMGLAPYGRPTFLNEIRQIVRIQPEGTYKLNLDYFLHHKEQVNYSWNNCSPEVGTLYSEQLMQLLGPARDKSEPLTQRHKDIARSIQAIYEEAFFALLNALHSKYRCPNLALSGGCAMNSVANGKVYLYTPFRKMFIPAAAGDAGGAIGAALIIGQEVQQRTKSPAKSNISHAVGGRSSAAEGPAAGRSSAYLGPHFSNHEIESVLKSRGLFNGSSTGFAIDQIVDDKQLCVRTARAIAEGKVVGWFQGRMEWGPRALGNRSILCDPRRADMKEILNAKIKRRESFRPFAPSILRERVKDWFEQDDDVPFMMEVFQIRPEKRALLPAVCHVDGSGRLQTVDRQANPLYHQLISAFCSLTSIPMVLNTSFNENEPVVCRPEEALDCCLRTKMDLLVLGRFFVERQCEEDRTRTLEARSQRAGARG